MSRGRVSDLGLPLSDAGARIFRCILSSHQYEGSHQWAELWLAGQGIVSSAVRFIKVGEQNIQWLRLGPLAV